jgi:hypothetical protein
LHRLLKGFVLAALVAGNAAPRAALCWHTMSVGYGAAFSSSAMRPTSTWKPYFRPFLWGAIRPAAGATINTRGDTSNAYLDARWEIEAPSGIFFSAGLGAAVHDGHLEPDAADRKALGSRVLFHVPLELGYRFDPHNSLSLYFALRSMRARTTPRRAMKSIGQVKGRMIASGAGWHPGGNGPAATQPPVHSTAATLTLASTCPRCNRPGSAPSIRARRWPPIVLDPRPRRLQRIGLGLLEFRPTSHCPPDVL